MKLDYYACSGCGPEWQAALTTADDKGKPFNPAAACPECGCAYFAWVNYGDHLRARWPEEFPARQEG